MPPASDVSGDCEISTNMAHHPVRLNFSTFNQDNQQAVDFDYAALSMDQNLNDNFANGFHDDNASRRPLVNQPQPAVSHGHLGQNAAIFIAQDRNTPFTTSCTHPEFYPPIGKECRFCSHLFDAALPTDYDPISSPFGLSIPPPGLRNFSVPRTTVTTNNYNTSFGNPYVPMAQRGLSTYNDQSSGATAKGPAWSRLGDTQSRLLNPSHGDKIDEVGQDQVRAGGHDQSVLGQHLTQPAFVAGGFLAFDFGLATTQFNGIDEEQGFAGNDVPSGATRFSYGHRQPVSGGKLRLVQPFPSQNVVDTQLLTPAAPSTLAKTQTDINVHRAGGSNVDSEPEETEPAPKKKAARKPRKKQVKKASPTPWQQDMEAQAHHDEIARNAPKFFEYTSSNNPVKHFEVDYYANVACPNQNLSVQEEIAELIKEHLKSEEEPPFEVDELMVMAALCVSEQRKVFLDAHIVEWLLQFKYYDLSASIQGQKEFFLKTLDTPAAKSKLISKLKHPLDWNEFCDERQEALQMHGFPIKRAYDGPDTDGFTIENAEGRCWLSHILDYEATNEGPFPFMEIPPDIRGSIYEMVFSFPGTRLKPTFNPGGKLVVCQDDGTEVAQRPDLQRRYMRAVLTPSLNDVLALLSVNKTIKAEAEGVFYEVNHFLASSFDNLKHLISRLPDARCTSFRNITIHTNPTKQKGRSVFQLLAKLKHLHYLKLVRLGGVEEELIEEGQSGEEAVKAHSGLNYLASSIKVRKLEFGGSGWPEEVQTVLRAKMLPKPLSKRTIGEVDDDGTAKPVKKARGRAAKGKSDTASTPAPAASTPDGAAGTSITDATTPMTEPSVFGN